LQYPLSAVITAENIDRFSRGQAIALVFLTQGVGRILGALVLYLMLLTDADTDFVWRFALILGTLPYILLLRWRWKLPETDKYTNWEKGNPGGAANQQSTDHRQDGATMVHCYSSTQALSDVVVPHTVTSLPSNTTWKGIEARLKGVLTGLRSFRRSLFATCTAWFLLDVFFYGQGMWSTQVLALIGFQNVESVSLVQHCAVLE
jgi:PHS family inorganic phosphate transporter-like MFS transporter